jgi:beta-glucosidase
VRLTPPPPASSTVTSIGDLSWIQPGDLETIAAPIDALGINYYNRAIIRDDQASNNLPPTVFSSGVFTDMGWEVYAEGLYNILMRVHRDYSPKALFVAENGASYADAPDEAGRIADARRIDFMRQHIGSVHRALQAGAPLTGYFVWSILDNFEWSKGYSQRFGMVWVDFDTQARLVKDSGKWYARLIGSNSLQA